MAEPLVPDELWDFLQNTEPVKEPVAPGATPDPQCVFAPDGDGYLKTPAYLKAVEGKKHREHSTYIRTAGRAIESMTPKRPCPACGGEHEPSLDNDPCKVCADKGYQTADEVDE